MELLSYAEELLGAELLWKGCEAKERPRRSKQRKRNGYAWRGMLGSGFDLHCNHSDGIDRQREAKHWNGFEMQAGAKE